MDDLQRLIAIEEIKGIKAKYFRGVDMKDARLLREVFAEDVELDYRGAVTDPVTGINHVPDGGGAKGRDAGADMIVTVMKDLRSVHHASAPEITITGENSAAGIWPMVDRLQFPSEAPIRELIGYGHYHETYERTDGSWKIKTLRLTRLRIDVVN